jgi:hypothetical protein
MTKVMTAVIVPRDSPLEEHPMDAAPLTATGPYRLGASPTCSVWDTLGAIIGFTATGRTVTVTVTALE